MGQISVKGVGIASAKPDFLRITVTTETVADEASAARAKHAERMSKVNAVIEKLGLSGKDVERSSFSYGENLVYNREAHVNERRGFKASSVTVIRYREFGGVPKLLDDLTAAGATGIFGPDFAMDDETKLADKARVLAFQEARRKAELMCEEAGVTLLAVKEITEREGDLYGGGKASNKIMDAEDDGETLLGDVQKKITLDCVFKVR